MENEVTESPIVDEDTTAYEETIEEEVAEREEEGYELVSFEDLAQRLNNLEHAVKNLTTIVCNQKIEYRRPESEEYETLAQTLDYLHTAVKELKNE